MFLTGLEHLGMLNQQVPSQLDQYMRGLQAQQSNTLDYWAEKQRQQAIAPE